MEDDDDDAGAGGGSVDAEPDDSSMDEPRVSPKLNGVRHGA
jgi:hypothetical protein